MLWLSTDTPFWFPSSVLRIKSLFGVNIGLTNLVFFFSFINISDLLMRQNPKSQGENVVSQELRSSVVRLQSVKLVTAHGRRD